MGLRPSSDLASGTLELLILKSLGSGPKHGYAIVEHLRVASKDMLHIGESALYPAPPAIALEWLGEGRMGSLGSRIGEPATTD